MALSKQSLSDRIYNVLVAAYGGQMDAVPEGGTQAGNQDLKPSRNLRILPLPCRQRCRCKLRSHCF